MSAISLAELAAYCRLSADAADTTGIPDTERDLWTQLANEINDYLRPADGEPDLFGNPTQGEPP